MIGLPPPNTKRWVARRKAAVVEAVSSGVITLEEACRRYQLSEEEFFLATCVGGLWRSRLAGARPSRHTDPASSTVITQRGDGVLTHRKLRYWIRLTDPQDSAPLPLSMISIRLPRPHISPPPQTTIEQRFGILTR